jgi:hypothetical protein
MINHNLNGIKLLHSPGQQEGYGIEAALLHAAHAEDLLTHAHALEQHVSEEAALGVYEKATDEYFKAHQAAGANTKDLGADFFVGLADSEEAIASADTLPDARREIAALHSISSLDQAISIGGLSMAKANRLRSRQARLIGVIEAIESAPREGAAKRRPAPRRLRESSLGHKVALSTDTIKNAGARLIEKFMSDDTRAF